MANRFTRGFKSPILLIGFNRPNETEQVLREIKKIKPIRLYFAVDGPRNGNGKDERFCQEVKALVELVDWPCQLFTSFSQENKGCKLGVSEAITWFLANEEQGIILEDDVIPSESFFYYCDDLLEKYADDKSVGLICGVNFIENEVINNDSYLFSKYSHIWGWATWRRAWELYDVGMDDWPVLKGSTDFIKKIAPTAAGRKYWVNIFDRSYEGKIDTWDYQLIYSCIKNNLLSVIPSKNMVLNIGFGVDATHTLGEAPQHVAGMKASEIEFPLKHPNVVNNNQSFDYVLHEKIFHEKKGPKRLIQRIVQLLKSKFI